MGQCECSKLFQIGDDYKAEHHPDCSIAKKEHLHTCFMDYTLGQFTSRQVLTLDKQAADNLFTVTYPCACGADITVLDVPMRIVDELQCFIAKGICSVCGLEIEFHAKGLMQLQ